jgi:CubicO group peptidase (beta-lactamase class C family)
MKKLLFAALVLLIWSDWVTADEHTEKLDKLMKEFDDIGMFSGRVLLAKDGSVIYDKTYGFADWENKTPVTKETLFRIGSLNKMFTHAMINQLRNEGKLDYSDPLSKYIDLYPGDEDNKITIKMLIEMSAGLGDYLNNPDFMDNRARFRKVDDFLELIKNEQLLFEPGTKKRYSNSGYVVLGAVIERITGISYSENLRQRFIEPLGLKNTFYRLIGEIVPNAASGTVITFSGEKKNSQLQEQPSPAGGMFSNADDLLKFDIEMRKTGLLPTAIRAGGNQVWNSVFAQLDGGYTLIINSNFSQAADEIIMRYEDMLQNKTYPKPDVTFNMKLYRILKEGGVKELSAQLKTLITENGMEYNDQHLNFFGYEIMNSQELPAAIEVFKLNSELFPDVPNVFDSLGEAYMNAGNKELAILNYRKVLEMDPGNDNAKKMLEKLGKQK